MPYYNVAAAEEMTPPSRGDSFSDFVDQRPVQPVASLLTTVYVETFIMDVSLPKIRAIQTVPQSFWQALADFEAGRIVDADIALSKPPPGA
jgi:hypothetical protein